MSDQGITRFTAIDDVVGMVPVEPDRVKPVSVLKATGANVVVFAFDGGAELREHTAQQPVLLQVLDGAVTVQLEGQVILLEPGGLLHIEPHVAHSVTAADPAHLQLTVLMIDSPGESQVPLAE